MQTTGQRSITIEVNSDGTTKVEANNFKGASCDLATREIELALTGGDLNSMDHKKKPDFFATNNAGVRQIS